MIMMLDSAQCAESPKNQYHYQIRHIDKILYLKDLLELRPDTHDRRGPNRAGSIRPRYQIDIYSTDTIIFWNSIVSCSPNLQNEQLLKFVSLWIILISWIHFRGRNMHLVSEILQKRGLTRFLRGRNMHFCVSCRNLG